MEIPEQESPSLCKFISSNSKLLKTRVKSIHLTRTEGTGSKFKMKKIVRSGGKHKPTDDGVPKVASVLGYDHCKLFKMVISLIAVCESLESLTLFAVNIPPDVLQHLGGAIESCRSSRFRVFGMKNITLKDDGMRILTPHLCKAKFKVIFLEGCELK